MTPLRTIRLQLDEGRLLPVEIRKQTTERSLHTRRELVELHGWTTTADAEVHRGIAAVLRELGERAVRAVDERGEHAGRWCVSWNSYGESAGVHTYSLLLREAEELLLETLVVGGLELYPYEYREDFVGDGLVLRAKMQGTEEEVEGLRRVLAGNAPFAVVRRGIHDEPREMRLGVGEWSVTEDGIKIRLVLVDRVLDGTARSELAWIAEENSRAALGFYANLLERLAEVMVEKGVLSRAELDGLREDARAAPGASRRELWKVADVDEL
jgi:hypothetical protein